jgi:hypothetical protein
MLQVVHVFLSLRILIVFLSAYSHRVKVLLKHGKRCLRQTLSSHFSLVIFLFLPRNRRYGPNHEKDID